MSRHEDNRKPSLDRRGSQAIKLTQRVLRLTEKQSLDPDYNFQDLNQCCKEVLVNENRTLPFSLIKTHTQNSLTIQIKEDASMTMTKCIRIMTH